MAFTPRTIYAASFRQDKKDGLGRWCAICCKNIGLAEECAIPRIPIAKGGNWKTENCVILCRKCFDKVGFAHTKEIPYSKLPCYRM